MDNNSISNRFQSILYVLIHFSFSLIELFSALGILGLQITLTVTETCAYRIGVGFWSFPFLFLSPISIWILLWKRNSISCFLTFVIHICSTLFSTIIIIVSFLVLINQIGSSCSTSNNYLFSINISLIAVSIFLKLFIYGEMILIYFLQRKINDPDILFDQEFYDKNYQILTDDTNIKVWTPFKSIINRN
jgi:hypothetical protein